MVELNIYTPYRPYDLYRPSVPVQGRTLFYITPMTADNLSFVLAFRKIVLPRNKYSLKQPAPCNTDANDFQIGKNCLDKFRLVVAMPWVMGLQIAD
jgi:hypothetical protein